MSHVSSIELARLPTTYRVFSDSPIGTLLRLRPKRKPNSAIAVGIHCLQPAAGGGGPANGIIPLDGDGAGIMVSLQELDAPGAIDVSGLLKICLADPAPQRPGGEYKIARLYLEATTGAVFMWCRTIDTLWVCIFDPNQDGRRGELVAALNFDDLIELGGAKLELIETGQS